MQDTYMAASDWPRNMHAVWSSHFGHVQNATGVPLVLGEFGGQWATTSWNGRELPATREWQQALVSYLVREGFGFFYWTLNDNSFKTGSLFRDAASTAKLRMLSRTPVTLMSALVAQWETCLLYTSPSPRDS